MTDEYSYWKHNVGRYSRRRLLRRMAVAGGAVAGAATLGCSSTRSAKKAAPAVAGQPPQPGGTYHTYAPANANTFDPDRGSSAATAIVTGNVYGGLFKLKTEVDPKAFSYEPVSDLALQGETPDGVMWTFKLRPDARFQNIPPVNGRLVEAEDVKASWARAFSFPDNTFLAYQTMVDPAQIETPAKDTVVFKLKYPYAAFPANTGGPSAQVLPREALAGAFDPAKVPIGAGPFLLDHYTPDVEVGLRKNPGWYETGRPYVDSLVAPIIPDAAQQLAQFTAGHLDVLRPPPNNLDALRRDNPKAVILEALNTSVFVVVGHMNHPASAFTDPRVRQGLSMALDRASLGKALLNNQFSYTGPLPPGLGKWALTPEQFGQAGQYYQYNLTEARRLLQASGAAGSLRRIMYPMSAYGAAFDSLAEAVSSQFNAAGLNLQLVPIDYNKDYLGVKGVSFGNFPDDTLVVEAVLATVCPEVTLLAHFQSASIRNQTQVQDPQMDAMLTKMLGTINDGARLQAALAMQRYLVENLYGIPLPVPLVPTAIQPWVHGFEYSGGDGAGTTSQLWIER